MKSPRSPRVKLDITEDLIKDAVARDSSHCLWAEAVKEAVPGASAVSVDLQTIRFSDRKRGLRFTYLTPRVAQISLVKFDQGILPEPHSVTLRGAQVTAIRRQKAEGKEFTDAQKKAFEANSRKARAALAKARLKASDKTSVPTRMGGKTPPIAAGRRRAFGLRGLEY
jgi:hypothetical protein